MVFFLVLSIFLAERARPGFAGLAFGLAMSIKIVPVLFIPTILLYLPTFRDRAKWASAAAVTWVAVGMPFLAQEPKLILSTIFSYEGSSGFWGFYMLALALKNMGGIAAPFVIYAPIAKWLALAAVIALPVALRMLRLRASLFMQCGLVSFLFIFLSPGFGLQYLAWTVPWIVTRGYRSMQAYYGIGGGLILTVYAAASRGTGVHAYADLTIAANLTMLVLLGPLCWTATGVEVWRYARLVFRRNSPPAQVFA